MRKFHFLILSTIFNLLLGSPLLVSAEPNISPEVENIFNILRLDLATQYIGSLTCHISIHYPDISLANKQEMMLQMAKKDKAEELLIIYQNSPNTEIRQRVFSEYIDENCSADFLESNWEN